MTEHSVIARRGKLTIREYRARRRRYAVPVVLVPALINRATILDLYDGGSFTQYLTRAGFDAYLLDWGVPGDEDRDVGFEELLLDRLPHALERIRSRTERETLALMGYCMGGTLVAAYAALARWSAPNLLVTLAAPIDFAQGGALARWCAPDVLDIDRVVDVFGNVPALLVEAAFTMLRPTAKARAALRFFENAADPRAHDAYAALSHWTDDWIPFPGRAARDWVRCFYQENRLLKGTLKIGGRIVDLACITAPVVAIAAEHDEIAPPGSVGALVEKVSSEDRSFVVLPGGHIGLVAGRSARDVLWPRIEGWLAAHSAKEDA